MAEPRKPNITGSRLGSVGPICEMTAVPEVALTLPLMLLIVLTPVALTLLGPGATDVVTSRRKPPPFARRNTSLASSGP